MNFVVRASVLLGLLLLGALAAQAAGKAKPYARENAHVDIDFTGVFEINEMQSKDAKASLQGIVDQERQGKPRRSRGATGVSVMGVRLGNGSREAEINRAMEEQELQAIITKPVTAIEIEQRPTEFLVDYGREDYDKFLNGEKVKSETGPGGQIEVIAGWHDAAYGVLRTYRNKTKITERFELLNDGRQLRWTMTIDPKKGDDTVVTRIYDRRSE